MRRSLVLVLVFVLGGATPGAWADDPGVAPPPTDVVTAFGLDAHYTKYLSAKGLPIVASGKVSDFALMEAAYIVTSMLAERQDLIDALAEAKVRYVVIAHDELTTDIPEYRHLKPGRYWDKRARGLGATPDHPAVSSGEENLLKYAGDPYYSESIAVHEFAHAIHGMGLARLDKTFDARLRRTFAEARASGLWNDTYAGSNAAEYFAEGVQSWFGTNRENDNEHNDVNTRDELRAYDPALARLLAEVFKENAWRYVPPPKRATRAHLDGFDPEHAPRFAWPEDLVRWYAAYLAELDSGKGLEDAARIDPAALHGARSRGTSIETRLVLINRTASALRLAWIDFDGRRVPYQTIGAGRSFDQSTFAGHVWTLESASGVVVAACRAGAEACRVIIEDTAEESKASEEDASEEDASEEDASEEDASK